MYNSDTYKYNRNHFTNKMRKIALILFVGFFSHIQAGVIPIWEPHDPSTNKGDLKGAQFCENLEVGTEIYTLVATGGNGVFEYSIVSPELRSYAEVNSSTGVITLTRKFDYEIEAYMGANVLVISDEESLPQTGNIFIIDDNDNAPFFYNLPYTVQDIYEYPWTVDELLAVKAEDVDNGASGTITLLFSDNLGLFEFFNYSIGNEGIVKLIEGQKLDFEISPVLATDIIAKDSGDKNSSCGGTRSLNTSTSFILQVLDGPNKPPAFDKPSYQFVVEENGDFTSETKVTARDQDYTLDWDMEYSILGSEANGRFSIDSSTGQLSVNSSAIDRDSQEVIDNGGFYTFTVQAIEVVPSDNSFNDTIVKFPFNATVDVSIQVIDINDNSPIFYELEDIFSFDDKIQKNVFNTTIDENTANAIALPDLNIFVQDIDDTVNAQFSLSLEGEGSTVFSVSPVSAQGEAVVTLRVANSSALDFEQVESYTFMIVAEEEETSHIATATVTVYLQDTNDNSPVFDEPGTLSVNVSENAAVGDSVITITATDVDSGINQEIKYSMDPETEFVINGTTGEVTVNAELDRERVSTYYLSVSATDGGNRVSMATLQVQLLDENDKSPMFQRSNYYGVVKEGSQEFTTELLILATDNDELNTPNSDLFYSIISGPIMEYFAVEQPLTTGGEAQIVVNTPIDFEDLPTEIVNCTNGAIEIELIVMAQDNGLPPLNGTVPVTILIEDINDNAPTFNSNYTAQVPENSQQGVVIIEVQATDADSCSPNNNIQYQIGANSFPASTSSAFKITTNDIENIGILEVNDVNLDRDEISEYEVEIWAIDEGSDRLTGTATILVTIEDINNKNPVFDETTLEPLNINENTTIGEVVETIVATDPDSNSDLFYNITDFICLDENGQDQDKICSLWFSIQNVNQTGELIVDDDLDREIIEFVRLQISVTDVNGTTPQQVTGWIDVNIIDENDNYPQFTNEEDKFTVKEEEAPGSYIGEVTATDADKGINSEIEFSVGNDGEQWINIGKVSGQLTSKDKHIDREEQGDWLNITVIATDKGNPQLSNETKIYIKIVDINDNVPEFSKSIYYETIPEDSEVGFVVLRVQAYDNDTNESIRYFITNGDDFGNFEINDTTGDISVRSKLDREFLSSYRLTVEARDNGGSGNSFSDTATVNITLEDINDESPKFTANIYGQTIREDIDVGDLVTDRISAHDPDEGINGEVVYEIVSGNENSHFRINSSNGNVFVKKSLENEEREYTLNISATDMGKPPYSSTCLLEIRVEDTNNNNPQFINLPLSANQTVSVPENVRDQVLVFKVLTYDNDTGLNADISYELTQGGDFFSINSEGEIRTRSTLDYENLQSVLVQVAIRDQGNPVLENEEGLTIFITDEDDNDPEYNNNKQTMAVDENNEVDQIIGKVNEASDRDTEINSINYYYIVGGTGRHDFSLDKLTRNLLANVALDREENDFYDLVVKATKEDNYTAPVSDIAFTSSDSSLLLVSINVTDVNDNAPRFLNDEYVTDIPHDTQAGTGAIVIEVTAVDYDLPENGAITYAITEAVWIINNLPTSAVGVFAIDTRDGKGQISVAKQIEGKQEGHYELVVTASDGILDHLSSTIVMIGIVQEDETVVLYSRYTPTVFTEQYQEQFVKDLEAILNATVIITRVIEHNPDSGFPQAQSDIYFHAKKGTSLIPKEQVIYSLNSNTEQTIGFLNDYGIIGNEGIAVPVTQENDYLKAGLIIASGIAVLMFILFTIAMCCQSRKFKQKISVLKAAEKASTAMQNFNKISGNGFDLPTTNVNAENPLYNEDRKIDIPMNFWQESSDDISIDDNAVDSQDDSAIGVENNAFSESPRFLEDDQLDTDIDIEFQSPNPAQLVAALKAASDMRGTDSSFANLFDAETGPDNTAM